MYYPQPSDLPEQVTESFVETSIALSKRVFSSRKLLDLLLEADETDSETNPFNNHTKLQLILNRAKSARNVEWSLFAM